MHAVAKPQTTRSYLAHEVARQAQSRWSSQPIAQRLLIIRKIRHALAADAERLAEAAAAVSNRPVAEKLVSEILPLADACRWLEKNATRVLQSRSFGSRGRPFWMQGVSFTVERMPVGLVLVIGPGNYPLFLPAVHALHALAVGNSVLLKPAPGTRDVALQFAKVTQNAGLDPGLLTVLPEGAEAAHHAIDAGVDKVIFTGSSENGRDVLVRLADTDTPSVMELSGKDAVLVFADADLDLVVRALRFGISLNGGETCIAPRRLIVIESVADSLQQRLNAAQLSAPTMESVPSETIALEVANASEFALGASIFSRDVAKAQAAAQRIKTGFVLINDLIAPTADPRMPFGGVKASGFGTTRGEEGLLELTFPHVVAVRRRGRHPHLEEPGANDAQLFSSYLQAVHGEGLQRFGAARSLMRALLDRIKSTKGTR
ncbi:MAG: aldehyde dehydrogenase family protein [Chthoniobacterales bacterium]